jgi:aryl-alcohol dehydrogenase-like predicted oxidoreductase
VELEVIPALRYYGVGLIPWSPLGDGRGASPRMRHQIDQHRSQLEAYETLCAQLGERPADVALA